MKSGTCSSLLSPLRVWLKRFKTAALVCRLEYKRADHQSGRAGFLPFLQSPLPLTSRHFLNPGVLRQVREVCPALADRPTRVQKYWLWRYRPASTGRNWCDRESSALLLLSESVKDTNKVTRGGLEAVGRSGGVGGCELLSVDEYQSIITTIKMLDNKSTMSEIWVI